MTTIYHYKDNTGEYTSSNTAKVDPLDGSNRIPANATTEAPLSVGDNQTPVWNGTAWVATLDLRGTPFWDSEGLEYVITDLNTSIPSDKLSSEPDLTESATVVARKARDVLLEASDNHALVDRITDSWRDYRQLLRDLPAQTGFPTTITWPTKPE